LYAVLRPVVVLLALSACTDCALTPAERAFTDSVLGPAIPFTESMSRWQGAIDWPTVRATGISFVFLKTR
jgi:hypothetical protein